MTETRPIEESRYALPPVFAGLQKVALGVGVVGAAACALGAAAAPEAALGAWLVASVTWMGVALGCLALSMIHHLTGGAWGVVARRTFEAAARTLPLFALLLVPVVLGVERLYPWARPGAGDDPLLAHKAPYLNPAGFTVRYLVYFAVWIGLAYLLGRWSRQQDASGDLRFHRRMKVLSAPGLVVWAFTVTFAMFDWLMSLEPKWFSTIYGVYFFGGFGLSALAFSIPTLRRLGGREPLSRFLTPRHFHDYGKLMLAFVLLWSYFALSQFLIIWAGNQPEEIEWYLHRLHHGWGGVALALVLLHFALPFVLLLSRELKRDARRLAWLALGLLAVRWLDVFWQVAPVAGGGAAATLWLYPVAALAVGGLFFSTFVLLLGRRPLVPLGDPYLDRADKPTGTVEATPYPGEAPSHG